MVKKKRPGQDEGNYEKYNKVADNKENTNNAENLSDDNTSGTGEESLSSDVTGTDISEAEDSSLEVKLAEMQDKYIRLSAEFDNYRKRTLREKMDLSKYAGEDILLKILPFMDDFDRARKNMELSTDPTAVKDGIDLIHSKLSEFLKQYGVKEIESMDCIFNVDNQEAVAKVPVQEEGKKGRVVDVILKGYYLKDKVLRFAKVVVGE